MIRLRRFFHLDALRDDRGMALAIAVIFGTVVVFMIATATSVAVAGIKKSSTDSDWNAALSAAYAGVQDYEARLSNDTGYTQYGNPAAPFSSTSTGLTLPTGGATNTAFGTGTTGTWATVPGGDGKSFYRYEVDSSKYYDTGVIRIRATGKVGSSVRSVVASIRQQGFIDFLYFTDYEIQDPVMTNVDAATCVKHAWEGRPTSTSRNVCGEIAFSGGDTIDGPAHSNDTMRICQATFTSQITTSNPTSGLRYSKVDSNGSSCLGQKFPAGITQPAFTSTIGMPSTNAQQKAATQYNTTATATRSPGCLYTGPTDITFNADGTMTVKSPRSIKTQTDATDPTKGQTPTACGLPGTGAGQLGSAAGATVPVPTNNLVYVQNVPQSGDANATTTAKLADACNTGNGVGYPRTGETQLSTSPCSYGTRSGDAFVHGVLDGQVTVAAENYLYVTGDMTYADRGSDMLGLTATNAVMVWNPVKAVSCGYNSTCYSSILGDTDREIDAAIISAAHTFQVQNYSYGGDRGTLTIYGAIAQKFRGVVRSGSNGYIKAYAYDARLKHSAPPSFLNPVTTTYGVTTMAEVSPAYATSGDCVKKVGVCV
jgi:Tfp pilus assembly protein PilX